jgi:hypothetical protein
MPSQKAVKVYVDNTKNALWPVGSTYIQFPGDSSPSTLGLPGTWSNVSSELAGDFIRFEGGNASSFESGEQGQQMLEHEHGSNLVYSDGSATNATGSGRFTSVGYGTTGGVNSPVPVGSDLRPINRTVRKWRRTA